MNDKCTSEKTIRQLIRAQARVLHLSYSSIVKRMGYTNISKGCRRLEAFLRELKVPGKGFIDNLCHALEISPDEFKTAENNSLAQGDRLRYKPKPSLPFRLKEGMGFNIFICARDFWLEKVVSALAGNGLAYTRFDSLFVPFQDFPSEPYASVLVAYPKDRGTPPIVQKVKNLTAIPELCFQVIEGVVDKKSMLSEELVERLVRQKPRFTGVRNYNPRNIHFYTTRFRGYRGLQWDIKQFNALLTII